MASAFRNKGVRLLISAGILLAFVAVILIASSDEKRSDPAGASEPAAVARLSDGLTDRQLAGQRMVAGFAGKTLPKAVERRIRAGLLGGVILFSENLGTRAQIQRLNRQIQAVPRPEGLRRYPLVVSVDQEGGLVKRLSGAPSASAEQMGSRGAAFSRRQGALTGRNLKNAGFNVDLAPVLDVARSGGVIADTDRGFGATPKQVEATAVPFARAMQANGVAATAKHFPGLGAAGENTDFAVQRIRLSKAALRRIDMAPYSPFIAAGGKLVMVGTAIYPALGPRPAAFEPRIVRGELRQRLGFKGVTITDAMGTVAVNDFGGTKRSAIAAAHAGMDILLYGDWQSAGQAEAAIATRLHTGQLDRGQFTRAVERILRLRAGLAD